MGDWFSYTIQTLDTSTDLVDELINRKLATLTKEEILLWDGTKASSQRTMILFHDESMKHDDGIYISLPVGESNGRATIGYYSKWVPRDELADNISKLVPDLILEIVRDFEWYEHIRYLEKDGCLCDKVGNDITPDEVITRLSSKLIKPFQDGYNISLPIGENGDKWGTFWIPEHSAIQDMYSVSGELVLGSAYLFLKGSYEVKFKRKTVTMSAKALTDSYYESKNKYRDDMQTVLRVDKKLALKEFPKGNYSVVLFHCSSDISSTEEISICVPEYNISATEYTLGVKGKTRHCIVYDDDRNRKEIELTHGQLYQYICA